MTRLPKEGYVYIITTPIYSKENIYKIGCTKDLIQRFKTLNASRIVSDHFYPVLTIYTTKYYHIETELHKMLHSYRVNNEFFRCSLQTIENALDAFAKAKPLSFIHQDILLLSAKDKHITYQNAVWSFVEHDAVMHVSDAEMVLQIKQWILNTFTSSRSKIYAFSPISYWEGLLETLKHMILAQDTLPATKTLADIENMANDFINLVIDTKTEPAPDQPADSDPTDSDPSSDIEDCFAVLSI